ncbi:translation initiation factor IF-2-like isoform X2 [Vidua macroura]|uniref:translation initiation factor IF-2-like isoform X2 n=1 Tax=Vidua macroura TaxID=187451 RepID=UPI0023A888EB|nr:translation initiation factor IF-2-like isoform X2 [Vidua macroura]
MAEERGAELGAAPERRREPVCRQRRSERSAARRGRWQPSWGAATAPRRGGAAAEGGGARGSGVCRRGGGGGRLHAQAPRAKLAAGGETGLACTERARLHGGGGRQQRGGSGVRRGCGGGTRGPPPRAGHRTLRDAERRSGAIPAIPGEAARIHSVRPALRLAPSLALLNNISLVGGLGFIIIIVIIILSVIFVVVAAAAAAPVNLSPSASF